MQTQVLNNVVNNLLFRWRIIENKTAVSYCTRNSTFQKMLLIITDSSFFRNFLANDFWFMKRTTSVVFRRILLNDLQLCTKKLPVIRILLPFVKNF